MATTKPRALKPERVHYVQNCSSRHGAKIDTIVLHITVSKNVAGLRDIDSIILWFDNPASQASSHVVNDREGHDARLVADRDKAWTQSEWNSRSLAIEQIEWDGHRSREQWLSESAAQLENTATWVAFWSHKYGIALTHRKGNGVCQHSDLGYSGGGHADCGPGYPLDWVIKRARVIRREKYGH